jgi:anaerobic selenocysteine-containing dehydrogenase
MLFEAPEAEVRHVRHDPETQRGTCPICGMGCFVEVKVQDGIPVRFKADHGSPHPADCPRAGQAKAYHNHPDRLNYPLKRVGNRGEGRWERIGWDRALDEIAAKLTRIRDAHGPEAVQTLGGSFKGPGDAACWRWANLFGTPNIMHQGKNCGSAEYLAEWSVYGTIGVVGYWPMPYVTKCAVFWGGNPPVPGGIAAEKAIKAARKAGTKIIVIDPRRSEAAELADIWLRIRPGADGALAYGLIHVIINEGLYDEEFVDNWCLGFEELKRAVQDYTPARVSELTWLPVKQIVEVARVYATHKPGIISFGLGTVELGNATNATVFGKAYLRAITGNLDLIGGQLLDDMPEFIRYREELHWDTLLDHPLRTRDNVGAGRWPVAGVGGMKTFREAMARVNPKGPGPAFYMMCTAPSAVWNAILDEDPYPIKAVITQGTNSLVALANSRRIHEAFTGANLDLHVVMDHWMTPHAQLADYVLPATDGIERPNLGGMWGFGNVTSAAVRVAKPLHERRDDYQLWRELGNRLGQRGQWPDTLEEWFDKLLEPSNITFAELAGRDMPWLFPAPPKERRYETTGFATFSGKVELSSSLMKRLGYPGIPRCEEPGWSPFRTPDLFKDYPLVMTAGASSPYYYRSQHKQLDKMRRQHPKAFASIHPETAGKLGIEDGDPVWVETPMGRVKQWAKLNDALHPGVVHADGLWWYPEQDAYEPNLSGVWESNINSILPDSPDFASFAGDNHLRAHICRVVPVEPQPRMAPNRR